MNITFEYNDSKISYTLRNNVLKIYSVPNEYSSDGLYIADYSETSLEPFPSSDGAKTKLLYHAVFKMVMGCPYIEVLKNEIGDIEYA
jgi:hypothetical protein